ncbi:hypothetical protein [Saccharolobus islandicus]|uniref:hypothetical protein n=1 Tax=Saccharolobus islandicus TaxID=43080 RepID=UPI001CEF939A|nr:hypothetical protein [Sulfolobus islandicus]
MKIKQKVEQSAQKEQKTKPETGEFNAQKPESKAENKVIAAAQGAANTTESKQQQEGAPIAANDNVKANGKLGSLTLKDLVIEILGKENGGYIVQVNGNKYYIKEEYLKILQTAAKDQELIKSISLDKLELKINLGVMDYTIPLAPL